MKTNSSGIKYFPINLQKKTMVYSGSQPQINFNPPVKTSNVNPKYEGINIKLKKEPSISKNIKESEFTQKMQIQSKNPDNNLNKSANISKKQIANKYGGEDNDQNSFNVNVITNTNHKSVSALYKKLNKLHQNTTQDNYFIVNNIINNVHNDNTNYNNFNFSNLNNNMNPKNNNINTNEFIPGYNNIKGSTNNNISTNNPKSNFYNNVPTKSSINNQGSSLNNNYNANFHNINAINTNLNNNQSTNNGSNIYQLMNGNRTNNTNIISQKQISPLITSNKASIIMKKIQERPPTQSFKNYKDKVTSDTPNPNTPDTNNINNYPIINSTTPYNQLNSQNETNLNLIRPSKLAKIAESNIKTNEQTNNFTSKIPISKEEKDKFEITIKSSSIGKSSGLYSQLGSNMKSNINLNKSDNNQNTFNVTSTSTVNQGQENFNKTNSQKNVPKLEIVTKETTLLSTYNKMSIKPNSNLMNSQANMNSKLTDNIESFTPFNNSLNLNPHDSKVKIKQQELTDNNNTTMNEPGTSNINKVGKHESFISKKPSKQQLLDDTNTILNQEKEILINSPENFSSKIPEHQIGKKSIKHYHQKSLSDNANIDGFTNTNINNMAKKEKGQIQNNIQAVATFSLELEKQDEEHLTNLIVNNNYTQIKNILNITLAFINLEDWVEQNQIEKHVNNILVEVFKLNSEDYEFFHKMSKFGLNKYLNRILKYYALLAMLIKFGILEFLLNNILQKKIKTILKIFNVCVFDFLYSTIICRLKYYYNNHQGNLNNSNSSISKRQYSYYIYKFNNELYFCSQGNV